MRQPRVRPAHSSSPSVARWRWTSTPLPTSSRPRQLWARCVAEPFHLEVVALEGSAEIAVEDDLPQIIVDALQATPSALPARDDDVLVVTQKVVPKAEGSIADLTVIEPRPEAI